MSSRRVKKGPGRRPFSAKRQRFMELRVQGWSIRGAAREVGISRSAAANWTRGYTVYRDGVAVRFVEPLDWSGPGVMGSVVWARSNGLGL